MARKREGYVWVGEYTRSGKKIPGRWRPVPKKKPKKRKSTKRAARAAIDEDGNVLRDLVRAASPETRTIERAVDTLLNDFIERIIVELEKRRRPV